MRCGLATSAVVCLLLGANAPNGSAEQDGKSLQGVWKLSRGEADGKSLDERQLKSARLEIKGDRYTVMLPDQGLIRGTQKLGTMKKLKTIDITDSTGARRGETCLGIYEIKGDEFHVVFAAPGKPRPTKFSTQPNSGEWMHVWTR